MQLSVLRPGLSSPRPFYQFMCQNSQKREVPGRGSIPGRGAKIPQSVSHGIGLLQEGRSWIDGDGLRQTGMPCAVSRRPTSTEADLTLEPENQRLC